MADQCIVCLEILDVQLPPSPHHSHGVLQGTSSNTNTNSNFDSTLATQGVVSTSSSHTVDDDGSNSTTTLTTTHTAKSPLMGYNAQIAEIQVCGHLLHQSCLKEWTEKANSCPICRQVFHLVHVYDKVNGSPIYSYKVEDKKQIAEFDPQAWLDENPEEEEAVRPCPVCNEADHEDVLLLCDNCDAPYHTYCVGLDSVPRGHWFCLECSDAAAELLADELQNSQMSGLNNFSDRRSDYLPRTQATMRRARQRARSDEWQGAWGQIAGHVWDALNIDLDNHEDDETFRDFRQSLRRTTEERREYERWQQRLDIASQLGAEQVFAENFPIAASQRVARQPTPPPPPPQESPEVKEAWGALEKAMETEAPNQSSPSRRKRKSRSVTASPIEPPPQERKLKRPRTRRVPTQSEASSSSQSTTHNAQPTRNEPSMNGRAHSPVRNGDGTSFLSSLLKEVETSPASDDENVRPLLATAKPSADPQSPAVSPSPSGHNSPRALSMTPPPRGINDRPGSPLSLSSWIEPLYPRANYIVARDGGEQSDSESWPRRQQQPQQPQQPRLPHNPQSHGTGKALEIRQPKPLRRGPVGFSSTVIHSPDSSPIRANLPFEIKESISGIVKDALKPHWKSGNLTADQYANINRDLSHKLYREVSEPDLDDQARTRFEKIATKEVAQAVAGLKV